MLAVLGVPLWRPRPAQSSCESKPAKRARAARPAAASHLAPKTPFPRLAGLACLESISVTERTVADYAVR
eukprot:3552945-Alexandrium_andersonii.AAC.1